MTSGARSESLPVDDIAKVVSGAVSSVLSKLKKKTRPEDRRSYTSSSDTDDFQPAPETRVPVPKAKRRKAAKKENKNKYV